MATRNEKKKCVFCKALIDATKYPSHVSACGQADDDDDDQLEEKVCALCGKHVKDLAEHCQMCSGGSNPTNDTSQRRQNSPVTKVRQRPTTNVSSRQVTKECVMCNKKISEDDYADHVSTCLDEPSASPAKTKHTKPYADESSPRPTTNVSSRPNTKECVMCNNRISEDDYADHLSACMSNPRASPTKAKYTKTYIDESSARPKNIKSTKACIICSQEIAEADYVSHVHKCLAQPAAKATNTKACIICSKEIAEANYAAHVDACLSGSSSRVNSKPAAKPTQSLCFTCSTPVDASKNSSHGIPCRSRHIYCLKCLRQSMNEYIQSNTAPVCHPAFCDYELSRYDVTCFPIESDTIKRLLTLIKSTQRPQCPLCLFYVNFDSMGDLDKHAVSCNSDNLAPCEYCHCLYNMHRLDEHARQCRNVPRPQQQQALIDFILPRTKYPFTAQQIRVFVEHRTKNRLLLDPHSIVDALAEFDGAFPFEIATRDCDVCSETCVYDDMYVFGCNDSHKLCYGCFERSCTTKMNNNEVITCGLCNFQLNDGELKQLRVPADQKRKFVEYQTQKTFNTYSASTQGVIKCPNKDCKWIAEAQNPNDRFQVTCPLCKHQFCSLCNQQYHFRTTCQEMPQLTQRWFFWCTTERGNYWQARAQQDASFNAQLQDYERQRAANTQRNEELRQRYNDLLADENRKAQTCRLCPHCRRIVEHLGGCDAMVCGRNYHGGDNQSGCGKGFNFSQALPYVPIGNTGPQQVRNDLPAPEQQKAIVHEGVNCDACQTVVQGIRFDCIHCSSLTFCEKCEQRSTLEHSNQHRDEQKQQHVFRLITRP